MRKKGYPVAKILTALILATYLLSAQTEQKKPPQKEEPKKKEETKPKPPGDPAIFVFYKGDVPQAGKNIKNFSIKVGEEITIAVQALDKDGRDTNACPIETKVDPALLATKTVEGKCKALKIKGLKKSSTAEVTFIYKGSKDNQIKAILTGEIK